MEQTPNTIEEIKRRQDDLALQQKQLELQQQITKLEQAQLQQITPPTQPNRTVKTPTIKEPSSGTITKRVASIEIINHLNNIKKVSIVAVAGSFLTAVGSSFIPIGGGVVAILVSVAGGYFFIRAKQESERLATAYNINLNAPQQK